MYSTTDKPIGKCVVMKPKLISVYLLIEYKIFLQILLSPPTITIRETGKNES